MAKVLINNQEIARLLDKLAGTIFQASGQEVPALVGIRSRGEIVAQRLQGLLEKRYGRPIDRGTLDITLYRDDINQYGGAHRAVRTTEITFSVDDRLIVLVDDVLNTGRSVRAALDALMDLGRPQAIRLAVLIDRGQRELPISADYTAMKADAPKDQRVYVYLQEVDQREEVVLE